MRPGQRAAKRADHSGLRRNTLALVHTELLVMHPSGISLNDHDAPHRTQTRKACCTCTCFHWIFACTKCARYLHSRLIVSSEFELPAIVSMWPTQLYRPSLPEKETSTLRPPSIDCATSFGFVPSADQRSIDVSRKARSLSKSVLGKSFSVGRERSGGMDRRSGGLSGIVTTPANACVAGAVCQRGGYYESSGGLGRNRKTRPEPRQCSTSYVVHRRRVRVRVRRAS